MHLAVIKNGCFVMIAIFGFTIQEFVSKQGVINVTLLFFSPIIETLNMYVNSEYIQHVSVNHI